MLLNKEEEGIYIEKFKKYENKLVLSFLFQQKNQNLLIRVHFQIVFLIEVRFFPAKNQVVWYFSTLIIYFLFLVK